MGCDFRKGLAALLAHGVSHEAAGGCWRGRQPPGGSAMAHLHGGRLLGAPRGCDQALRLTSQAGGPLRRRLLPEQAPPEQGHERPGPSPSQRHGCRTSLVKAVTNPPGVRERAGPLFSRAGCSRMLGRSLKKCYRPRRVLFSFADL